MIDEENNDQSLALLRDLPVEVSIEQVAQMVAAFPVAAGASGWLASIKTNLNTLLMFTVGTFIIGTAIYFMPASTPEVQSTAEAKLPEVTAPAPVSTQPLVENVQPAKLLAFPVADTARALVTEKPVTMEPVPTAPPTPITPALVLPVVPPALPSPAPLPAAPILRPDANNKTYEMRDFTSVVSFTSGDVIVQEGDWSVTANGDPDLLDRLEINVEKGALNITMRKGKRIVINDRKTLKVEVQMPHVTSLEQHGSGDIIVGDLSGGENLTLTAMGSGDIDVESVKAVGQLTLLVQGSGDINCRSTNVIGHTSATVLGSGDVEASGQTATLEVLVQGSGDVDTSRMPAQSGEASLLGSGDAVVNCTGKLEQLIQGSGTVRNTAGSTGE